MGRDPVLVQQSHEHPGQVAGGEAHLLEQQERLLEVRFHHQVGRDGLS